MPPILFFNADQELKTYADTHPIPNAEFVFFEESLNAVPDTTLKKFKDSEILSVFVHSEQTDMQKLELFPNLKLIATRSTGFNHIDLNYCKNKGIHVVNVPCYGEATVAEFAFGLLLALSRKIIIANNAMTRGDVDIDTYIGMDLMGKTLGIIGTGSIGRHMIQIARGFGMEIIAYDLFPAPDLKEIYVPSLDQLYARSDIISLHIPSTSENFHLLNETAFSKMKQGVLLINTARGDLIDTQALYHALRQGIIGGAGLDVLENEDFLLHDDLSIPQKMTDQSFLLDSALNLKLLQFKNVIATPHIAFNSSDAVYRILKTTFDNIHAFLNGTLQNSVIK